MATAKKTFPGEALLFPAPAVLVSCGTLEGPHNVMTASWAGVVCTEPPVVALGVRRERHSHGIICKQSELVINVPGQSMLAVVDRCGLMSGRDGDKFARLGLTPVKADQVAAPLVDECPLNLECRVTQALRLGSHDLFLCQILCVHLAEGYQLADGVSDAILYAFGKYYGVRGPLEVQGFSTAK